tara:strand:- start:489 stop:635 length:147 start_codon:yes stop_codon:yes gene_type:complete
MKFPNLPLFCLALAFNLWSAKSPNVVFILADDISCPDYKPYAPDAEEK